MKKVLVILMLGLFSGIMLQSCKPSDKELQEQVTVAVEKVVPGISAIVQDGTVTLSGVVESEDAKTSLETLTKQIKGIKSVINNITVHKPEPPVIINPDAEIKTTVENLMKEAGFNKVSIEVKDGEVILTGDVKKADLAKVMQIANESNPKKVINQLNIK